MNGLKRWPLAISGVLLLLSLALPTWVQGQQEPTTPEPEPAQDSDAITLDDDGGLDRLDQTFGEEPEDELEAIDDLLEGEIEVLETGFTYDDGGRRDPFHSLLDIAREPEQRINKPRPPGIAGLSIDEISVMGVWIYPEGPVAQVQAANKAKSFLIRPGDQLWDGDVLRINYVRYDGSEVVFKQIVDDPTATKPFREVVRRIEQ